MNTQLLLVGEDTFFGSSEFSANHKIVHVKTQEEALSLISAFDFGAIIARDGAEILKVVRAQGKHTPFLNLSQTEMAWDCCGGHMSPEASAEEKTLALGRLVRRNHDLDCL